MPTAARSRVSAADASPAQDQRTRWIEAFRRVRGETERRAAPLSPEDQVIQSMPDASPTKWHRAHTTWFFETFLVQPNVPGYKVFDERFAFLFNSYYVAAGPRHARPKRGLITRPNAAEVADYRAHVDAAVETLIAARRAPRHGRKSPASSRSASITKSSIRNCSSPTSCMPFAQNPTSPAYDKSWQAPRATPLDGYVELPEGIHTIGHQGEGYCFDNEGPSHRVLVGPVRIARGLVTNGEWLEFIKDGGYANPALWLSDGWAAVQNEGWAGARPLAGERRRLVAADARRPEAGRSGRARDACQLLRGGRVRALGRQALPTEQEWEVAARGGHLADAYGIVWQWTRSAYSPYPGFAACDGALGEYNGKFMINQMVLRGSSLATPEGHSRVTYRNFFYPPARWQFTGVRLADYAERFSLT